MHLIKPSQISGQIMTLIEEADSKIILVSPYFRVSKWYKFLNRLERINKKEVIVEIYIREGEFESVKEVLQVGFQPITIPNLHTKLYLNEKCAIVSSMNLLHSSDISSLDIALKTETKEEYQELFSYYDRYIKRAASKFSDVNQTTYDWLMDLELRLHQVFTNGLSLFFEDKNLLINARNRYEAFIVNGTPSELRISAVLSQREFQFLKDNPDLFESKKMAFELIEGSRGSYDKIWGIVKGYKSFSLQDPLVEEQEDIVEVIAMFVSAIEQMKDMAR